MHDLNYRFTHRIDSKGKTFECQSCHQVETFCANCQAAENTDFAVRGIIPASHLKPNFFTIAVGIGGGEHAILARRDIERCTSCHDVNGSDPTCITCHLDSDGIKGTNPKTHARGFMKNENGDWHEIVLVQFVIIVILAHPLIHLKHQDFVTIVMGFKMNKKYFYLTVMILSVVIISSCSDMRVDVPPALQIGVHKDGIINPSSPNFHGALIQNLNWDLKECQNCHAADYSGGITGANCFTCHTQPSGPEACNTCHGQFNNPSIIAPNSGAHYKHLYTNSIGMKVVCVACHKIPANFNYQGHIDDSKGAEVNLSDLALNVTNEI